MLSTCAIAPRNCKPIHGVLGPVIRDTTIHEQVQEARRANQPKVCLSPRTKIFRFRRRANQEYKPARLTRYEGRLAIVTNARWDAVAA